MPQVWDAVPVSQLGQAITCQKYGTPLWGPASEESFPIEHIFHIEKIILILQTRDAIPVSHLERWFSVHGANDAVLDWHLKRIRHNFCAPFREKV